ncbi:MAG: O-antigen ligase family protein [Acidobacteria bacterium]|nr:O-antigen ligase family protein [Acidobacteriota bacterium]
MRRVTAMFRRRVMHVVDSIGLALLVTLLWRVFFTFNTNVSWSVLAASIGAAGVGTALLEGRPLRTTVDAPVVWYVMFTLASAAAAYGRYPAFAGLIPVAPWHPGAHLVLGVLYFYGLVSLIKTPRRLGALMAVLVIAVSAVGGIAIYDHARFGFGRLWEYPLLPQWLGYPHIGLLLAVAFPISAAVASARSSVPVLAAGVTAIVIALIATTLYSRAALFSIVIAYAGLCGIEWRKFKTGRLAIAAVVIALMTFVGLTASGRMQSLAGSWASPEGGLDASTSLTTRSAVWRRTATMIRDHPVLGVGPGNYTVALENGYVDQKLRENGHAHNMLLHVAAEQGLPAAIAFLIIWYRLGWMLIRQSARTYRGVLAAACFGALLAFFTRSLTDHFLASTGSPSERTTFVMWTLLAAAASVGRFRLPQPVSNVPPVAAAHEPRAATVTARVWESARRLWDDGRIAFYAMLAFGLACEAQALFVATPPIRAAGTKPYIVDDFGAGAPIGQTFRMMSDGLASVRLQFFASRPETLLVKCRLLAWADYVKWVPLYEWSATVDLPSGPRWHEFQFPPVIPSDRIILVGYNAAVAVFLYDMVVSGSRREEV